MHSSHKDLNFLIILTTSTNTSALTTLKEQSLKWPDLHQKLDSSLVCSFQYQKSTANDLWTHFSLISNPDYLANVESISLNLAPFVDYLQDREYLLSFHTTGTNEFLGREWVSKLVGNSFDINLEG